MIPDSLKNELESVARSKNVNLHVIEVEEGDQEPFALSRKIEKDTFQIGIKRLKTDIPDENLRRILFHELGHCVFLKDNEYLKDKRWKKQNILNFCMENRNFFNSFLVCYEAVEFFLELIQELFAEKFSIEYCNEYSPLTDFEDREFVEELKRLPIKQKRRYFEELIIKKYRKWDSVTFIKELATWGRFIILCSEFSDEYGCREVLSAFPSEFKNNMIKLGEIVESEAKVVEKLKRSKTYLKKQLDTVFDTIRKREGLRSNDEIIKELYSRLFDEKEKKSFIKKNKNLVKLILQVEFGLEEREMEKLI